MKLAKGKPPLQQPYYGADSSWYLTPEYLRGAAACERAKPSVNAVHVHDGDTILLWDGSNAGEVFLGRSGMLASTMTIVSPDKRFTPHYFFFALKQWEAYLKGQTSGSGIPHVDKEVLGKLEITEFAEPEQSKIAEVLSTVDRAIAQTETLIAKQQCIKTGLMQDLLTRGIDEHGQLRSEATHAFKDSPLGRIPVEWEVSSFAGSFRSGPQNGLYKPESEYSASGISIVRIDGFHHGGVISSQSFRRLHVDDRELARFGLEPGDLLVNRVNTLELVGKSALVAKLSSPTVFESNIMRVRLDESRMLPEFGILQLTTPRARRHFSTTAKPAVAQASINQHDVGALMVAIPSLQEQSLIAERLNVSASALANGCARLRKFHLIKTALMQDLLTGKVRVTPLLQAAEAASA